MTIKIKIGKKAPKEQSAITTKLQIRKTLNGNIVIYDHEDLDIVISPENMKIVTLSREMYDDKTYETSDRLFKFLIKNGIVDPETVHSGNIFGSMEGVIYKNDKINSLDMAILTISKWIEQEKPLFIYTKEYEEKQEEELLNPSDEDSTEQGEYLHKTQKKKDYQAPDANYNIPYILESKKNRK